MAQAKSRREEYSEATRAALLDAATRLFYEQGFTGTTLEDVAAAARVTRGAVYHHFAGKQVLFEAVLERVELRVVQDVLDRATAGPDALRAALVGLEVFLDHCCDPVYGRLCWREGPLALGWHRWIELEERYAYGVTERLVRGLVESGYLRSVPLALTTRYAFALLGAAGTELAEASEEAKPRVRADSSMLIRRFLVGLLTPEAAERSAALLASTTPPVDHGAS
ncbi:DNA-binding transcriptional regulator, AcrR family [Amycolatopsis arida]|uniref:DNA-binding transcriptional regulator, AcrR family n=1 Tax=Amycolatopsis arida TaxID=587909 RepID=A0A1I5WGB2_9PSEU|nr:TetR/AcrR family transcriptional regulator [Amycolatopsis arida]TDX92256.1 AcrR family transcriptional regulator [Amycolatopsis arida]SFQ18446.1 DNA-binding transcriptional regulator, AcrR family [Amycolatopsis arida]